jgi:plasmid stabilization system protein ParE
MKVEYSARALADLRSIAAYYVGTDYPSVGEKVAARIREVVARLAVFPASGRPVPARPGLPVVPLRSYPYVIFYRVTAPDVLRIAHIRRTSRRPWAGG